MLKISLQTSRANNSRILSIKNAKDFQSIVFIKTKDTGRFLNLH